MLCKNTHHDRPEHRDELLRLRGIESGCLLNALLHRCLVLAKDGAEHSARSAVVQQAAEPAEHGVCPRMRVDSRLHSALAAGLLRGAGHSADDHRHGRLHGVLGDGGLDAQSLADLLDLVWPELLAYGVDEAHVPSVNVEREDSVGRTESNARAGRQNTAVRCPARRQSSFA